MAEMTIDPIAESKKKAAMRQVQRQRDEAIDARIDEQGREIERLEKRIRAIEKTLKELKTA